MRAVVVGGGIGGLLTSIRLAARGWAVTVLERSDAVGGKLATLERDGFRIDLGPTLFTMPHLFDEVFALAGSSLADEVDLSRVDPQFRYHWPDGSELTIPADDDEWYAALANFNPDEIDAWRTFERRAGAIWELAERTFLAGPAMGVPATKPDVRDALTVDGVRSLDRRARALFRDRRLVQLVGRYATYSGSSPLSAPATLACIHHIERQFGTWHIAGGLGGLAAAARTVAERVGVTVHTGVDVTRIATDGRGVQAVMAADGERWPANIVIANVDAEHLYQDLLPRPRRARRLGRHRSQSAVMIAAGVRGTTPNITHHQVWFSPDNDAEFRALSQGRPADDPTIYACVASTSDDSMAPPGDESWHLLVTMPAGLACDRAMVTERFLDQLAGRGVDLRSRLAFAETLTPADLADRYRASGGAIYGTSSNGRRAAFVRPANRGPVSGLYLVGGSAHPGGGLPLVAIGSRIVTDLIEADGVGADLARAHR